MNIPTPPYLLSPQCHPLARFREKPTKARVEQGTWKEGVCRQTGGAGAGWGPVRLRGRQIRLREYWDHGLSVKGSLGRFLVPGDSGVQF